MRLTETKWPTQGHGDSTYLILEVLLIFSHHFFLALTFLERLPFYRSWRHNCRYHHGLRSCAPNSSARNDWIIGTYPSKVSPSDFLTETENISTLENQAGFYCMLKIRRDVKARAWASMYTIQQKRKGGKEGWSRCEEADMKGEAGTLCFSWDRESNLEQDCFQSSHSSYTWTLEKYLIRLQ